MPDATGVPPDAYRELVESAPDGILLVSEQGEIRFANPEGCRMLGYQLDEILGMNVDELVPLGVRDHHAEHRESFLESPRKRPMGSGLDLAALRKDGSQVPVEISLSPTHSGDERLILALIRDVTQRRQAEDTIRELTASQAARVRHLEALNAELESFSYSVSHDLRAPLRAIDGFSLALLEDYGEVLDSVGQDYLNRVRAGAQRMAQLIDDLLELSRVSRAPLNPSEVNVSDLAAVVVRDLRGADRSREVVVDIDPGIVVTADARLLRLALENLLGNAWKFTSRTEWARIQVSGGTLDGVPAITITDNGAGFDQAYSDRIFDAFQRLHSHEDFPGTGVGLAIVQRIVFRHGGRIIARSPDGAGATFTIRTMEPTTDGGLDLRSAIAAGQRGSDGAEAGR